MKAQNSRENIRLSMSFFVNYDRASAIFNLVKIKKNIVKIYSVVKSVKLLWFKYMFWVLRRNYVYLDICICFILYSDILTIISFINAKNKIKMFLKAYVTIQTNTCHLSVLP